jgi:hypothetical protein
MKAGSQIIWQHNISQLHGSNLVAKTLHNAMKNTFFNCTLIGITETAVPISCLYAVFGRAFIAKFLELG